MPEYRVCLSEDEIICLNEISHKCQLNARTVLYARALLLLDEGEFARDFWDVKKVSTALGLSEETIHRLTERFVLDGLDAALKREKHAKDAQRVVFDDNFEDQLIRLVCSYPPAGHKRWTVKLLARELVESGIIRQVLPGAVQRVLDRANVDLSGHKQ